MQYNYREPSYLFEEQIADNLMGVFGVGREGSHTHIGHFGIGLFSDDVMRINRADSHCCDRINGGNRSYLQKTSGTHTISCKKCNPKQKEFDLDKYNERGMVAIRTFYGLTPYHF